MRGNEHARKEVNATVSDEGTFDGILASYNNVDWGGDLIEPGAFTKTIAENNGNVPLLWQHKTDSPIGNLELVDGPDALRVHGSINLKLRQGYEAYISLKDRIIKGLSIGYDTLKAAPDGPIRRLKEIRLWEGSIVTFAMDPHAAVMSVKAARERKDDFAAELAETQLISAGSQMMDALYSSLSSLFWAVDMTKVDKLAMAQASIQQFDEAYMAWLPEFLDWLAATYGDMKSMDAKQRERKAGREISTANKQKIKTAHEHLTSAAELIQPLCADEAGPDDGTTSTGKAGRKSEPDSIHSAAKILDDLRSLIPQA